MKKRYQKIVAKIAILVLLLPNVVVAQSPSATIGKPPLPYTYGDVLIKFKPQSIDLSKPEDFALVEQMAQRQGRDIVEVLTGSNVVMLHRNDNFLESAMNFFGAKTDSVPSMVDTYDRLNDVEFAQPNFIYYSENPFPEPKKVAASTEIPQKSQSVQELLSTFNDPLFRYQWHLFNHSSENSGKDIRFLGARKIYEKARARLAAQNRDSHPIVGVTGMGVSKNLPDLQGAMWSNDRCILPRIPDIGDEVTAPNYGNCVGGSSSDGTDPDPIHTGKTGNHENFIANIIASQFNNTKGSVGIAPDVKIMGLRLTTDDQINKPYRYTTISEVKMMNFAKENGADIVNMSLATKPIDTTEYENEYEDILLFYSMLQFPGVIVISAGNEWADINDPKHTVFPAAYAKEFITSDNVFEGLDNIINVAAEDSKGNLSSFSNYGSGVVHLVAPGEKIVTSQVEGDVNSPQILNGTSFAAPIVAGALAMAKSAYPDKSMREIKDVLLRTVTKVPEYADKTITGGRLNLYAMMAELEKEYDPNVPEDLPSDNGISLADNEDNNHWESHISQEKFNKTPLSEELVQRRIREEKAAIPNYGKKENPDCVDFSVFSWWDTCPLIGEDWRAEIKRSDVSSEVEKTTWTNTDIKIRAVFNKEVPFRMAEFIPAYWKRVTDRGNTEYIANATKNGFYELGWARASTAIANPPVSYEITNIDKLPPLAPTAKLEFVRRAIEGNADAWWLLSYSAEDAEATKDYGKSEIKTFQCRFDNGSWQECPHRWSLVNSGIEFQTISVRAVDNAGNIGPETQVSKSGEVSSPGSGWSGDTDWKENLSGKITASTREWTNQDVKLSLTFNKNVPENAGDFGEGWIRESARVYTKMATKNSQYSAYWKLGGTAPGPNATFVVQNIDKLPPPVPTTTGISNTANTLLMSFEGDDAEATQEYGKSGIARFECQEEGGQWNTCTSPLSVPLSEATKARFIRAVDKAGNRGEAIKVIGTGPTDGGRNPLPTPPNVGGGIHFPTKYTFEVGKAIEPIVLGTPGIIVREIVGAPEGIRYDEVNKSVIGTPTKVGTFHAVAKYSIGVGNLQELRLTIKITDTTPPAITINGSKNMTIQKGSTFVDPGATCQDNYDKTCSVQSSGAVNAEILGQYTITYTARDSSGNVVTDTRRVIVEEGNSPVLPSPWLPEGKNPPTTLEYFPESIVYSSGSENTKFSMGGARHLQVERIPEGLRFDFEEMKFVWEPKQSGEFSIIFTYTYESGLKLIKTLRLIIPQIPKRSQEKAEIALVGDATIKIRKGDKFVDAGAVCVFNNIQCSLTKIGNVDTNIPGVYTITYTWIDPYDSNNIATRTRTVIVEGDGNSNSSSGSSSENGSGGGKIIWKAPPTTSWPISGNSGSNNFGGINEKNAGSEYLKLFAAPQPIYPLSPLSQEWVVIAFFEGNQNIAAKIDFIPVDSADIQKAIIDAPAKQVLFLSTLERVVRNRGTDRLSRYTKMLLLDRYLHAYRSIFHREIPDIRDGDLSKLNIHMKDFVTNYNSILQMKKELFRIEMPEYIIR